MKIIIWEKDDFFHFTTGPRIDMDPDVVKIGEGPLELVWSYDWLAPAHGQVTDLRVEDGEIVGEATFFKPETEAQVAELLKHKDIRFGGYYNNVTRKGVGDNKEIVTQCELKAVSIVMVNNMPGADIKKE